VKIGFPIIADLSMEVAHKYGMIQPGASDTSAVRATFIIVPPPATMDEAAAREGQGYQYTDWYFSKKSL